MDVVNAKSFKDRLFGLAFRKNINVIMKFEHCNSIHTFFMKSAIDVYFVDKDNVVKYVFKSLSKNKVILPKKDIFAVYETKVNLWNYKIGDKIDA